MLFHLSIINILNYHNIAHNELALRNTDSCRWFNNTKGKLLTRRLDCVSVVGINETVRIHEIPEINADATDALFEQVYLFHKALDIFESRNRKDAEAAFNQVLNLFSNDGPSKHFIERCHQ
jgi:hypothetical protein